MSAQLRFFRKNLIDLSESNNSWSVTDSVASNTGVDFVNLMLNRDNDSGWATTGSSDAGTTTLVVTFNDVLEFDAIILAGHNLKSFTLKYWDDAGSAWTDFSTPVNETTNTKDTSFYSFTAVNSTKLQLVINGTQVADADKIIRQFIVTKKIRTGQLEGWPILKKPQIDLSRKQVKTISGKAKIIQRVGAYSVTMQLKSWPSDEDLHLFEDLHFMHPNGFLFWPNADDSDQFRYERIGYRAMDIYLCGVVSEWSPEWAKGIYVNGMDMNITIAEVI